MGRGLCVCASVRSRWERRGEVESREIEFRSDPLAWADHILSCSVKSRKLLPRTVLLPSTPSRVCVLYLSKQAVATHTTPPSTEPDMADDPGQQRQELQRAGLGGGAAAGAVAAHLHRDEEKKQELDVNVRV